mgnify:FL=1
MKKFSKNIVKEFKNSFGRFLAIMAIIALGVGFLIGISQATPDMKTSMSDYLKDNAAYDIDVKAAYGLTLADIDKISSATDDSGDEVVSAYMPAVTSSIMASIDGANETAVNLIGIDFSVVTGDNASGDYLNHLTLEEGSWPSAADEVVVERANNYFEEAEIGDKIVITDEITTANSTYGDIYAQKEFTVVGIVSSPDYYYRDAREVTTVGTGVVSLVMYGNYSLEEVENADGGTEYVASDDSVYDLSKENSLFWSLNLDSYDLGSMTIPLDPIREDNILYTDLWVQISGSDGYECFYTDYKDYVLNNAAYIEEIGNEINAEVNAAIEDSLLSGAVPANASWYVLDRASTNVSYVSFDMNVEKVEDIAGIFPIFFIVVAALVALTSMTRMVEQDRMQIGTLKALGYRESTIMIKYLVYCILACIIGLVVGILLGFSIMPNIFWNAYRTMYFLPSLYLGFSWWLALAVVFGSLAVTIVVTIIACRTTTKEKPSTLMQPKAPKPGKRILLERCTPIWKRIKFKWKATIRNIFRYKKNMILTIVSVMGCTALILTGFGLGDSVAAVTELQYNDIIFYDTVVSFDGDYEYADGDEHTLESYIDSLGENSYTDVYSESGQLILGDSRESVDMYLVTNSEQFSNFVSLHSRASGDALDVAEDGIIIPENIATVYDISAGDEVTYRTADGAELKLTVSGVCEYYTGSDVYMSADNFTAAVEAEGGTVDVSSNAYLIRYGYGEDEDAMNAAAESLLSDPAVTGVEFTYTTLRTFDALNDTMSFVILILVVCAGALAAIVLYNLTNINIDERRKEIATLRVLGYTKWEVAGYIYRESGILTIVGALFGLLVGWLLHMYIVGRVNSVWMMFGKAIAPLSFLWAFLITLGFAIVVYAFMLIKLYKINMAESLKSNE